MSRKDRRQLHKHPAFPFWPPQSAPAQRQSHADVRKCCCPIRERLTASFESGKTADFLSRRREARKKKKNGCRFDHQTIRKFITFIA